MPYFLVSHTALVEADDETTAAVKAYDELCDRENIAFDVTADEHTTTKVTIPTRTSTSVANTRGSALPCRHDGLLITSEVREIDTPADSADRSASILTRLSRLSKSLLARLDRQ
jgi:hypothetical protein